MSASQPSMFSRPDTLMGICQAIGEDLGINPTWVRALLACGVFFNLAATIGVYLGLGVIVAVTRWLFPAPAPEAAETATQIAVVQEVQPVEDRIANEDSALPIAA